MAMPPASGSPDNATTWLLPCGCRTSSVWRAIQRRPGRWVSCQNLLTRRTWLLTQPGNLYFWTVYLTGKLTRVRAMRWFSNPVMH